jgi:hypothetical protein
VSLETSAIKEGAVVMEGGHRSPKKVNKKKHRAREREKKFVASTALGRKGTVIHR